MTSKFFSQKTIDLLKHTNNEEFITIKNYLYDLIDKDDKYVFHPFCVATGTDNKFHKFAWFLLAQEIKIYALGILYILESKSEYIKKAQIILNKLINMPIWSDNYERYNKVKNTYPETSAIIKAFSFAIDVFGEDLGKLYIPTKKRLSFACQRLYEIIINKEETFLSDFTDEWSIDLGSGLGIASIILEDFDDRSSLWLDIAKKIIIEFLDNLPKDGSYVSGLLRWEYSIYNACILTNALYNSGKEDIRFHPILEKTKYFALKSAAPLCSNLCQFDQSIDISIYNPLNGILSKLLTKWYNDPYLAWGIKNSPKKKYYHPFELFFTELNTEPKEPNFSSIYFPEKGIAFLRSGWKENDNLITFKSASKRQAFSHKDQNNFELFLGKEKMLIESGTCYRGHPNYEMRYSGTHAHNAVLIDNKPQLPKITQNGGIIKFISKENYDFVKGDATSVYSKAKKFIRNFLFIKPNLLILYDYIELNSLGSVEWLFHTPGSIHIHSLNVNKNILFKNNNKSMSMFILKPNRWSYRITKDFTLENWETMHETTHDVFRIRSTKEQICSLLSIFYLNSANHEVLPCEYKDGCIYIEQNKNNYEITLNKSILLINGKEI